MQTNKHMIVAMIVAPILAIISYFATDYIISEPPVSAQAGESYALLARPNCRYQSGACTLKNGDVELNLRLAFEESVGEVLLATSNMPLTGVKIAIAGNTALEQPVDLVATGPENTAWILPLQSPVSRGSELQLAMESSGRLFYVSTETTFFDIETSFGRKSL